MSMEEHSPEEENIFHTPWGARRLVGGEVDRRPFEALSFELLP